MPAPRRRLRRRAVPALLGLALCSARGAFGDCTFSTPLDQNTEYTDAVGDAAPTSAATCEAACCADPNCQCYQWSDDPAVLPPACRHGTCDDPQDSGGIIFTGETGKSGSGTPASGPGGAGGAAGASGWGKMFLIFFCLAAGVYVFGTVGYKFKVQDARGGDLVRPFLPIYLLERRNSSQRGVQLPNPEFWGSLGGLVKDGVGFTMDQAQGKKGSKEGYDTITSTAGAGEETPPPKEDEAPSPAPAEPDPDVEASPKATKRPKRKSKSRIKKAAPAEDSGEPME